MTDTDEICGYEGTTTGEPCRHPADSCPVPSHSDEDAENPQGRPNAITEEKRESLYNAVGMGMEVWRQAALIGVSERTLQRTACCLETLREPRFTTDKPCDFCRGYARAHTEGAMETVGNCSAEYRAAATFGIVKTERRELTGKDGGAVEVRSDVVEVTEDTIE